MQSLDSVGRMGCPAQERRSKEGRRAGRRLLLLSGIQGAKSATLQAPYEGACGTFYHLLSSLSAQKSGLISVCSFRKYLLTPYSEPTQGSPYLVS